MDTDVVLGVGTTGGDGWKYSRMFRNGFLGGEKREMQMTKGCADGGVRVGLWCMVLRRSLTVAVLVGWGADWRDGLVQGYRCGAPLGLGGF
jgi:hypothetical protein